MQTNIEKDYFNYIFKAQLTGIIYATYLYFNMDNPTTKMHGHFMNQLS